MNLPPGKFKVILPTTLIIMISVNKLICYISSFLIFAYYLLDLV